jgi:hypothetical protein
MRRVGEGGGEPPSKKPRQATLSYFLLNKDGQPFSKVVESAPIGQKDFSLPCPYCDRLLASDHKASLPGALRLHVQLIHVSQYLEFSTRESAAVSFIRQSIFEIEPMPTIAEEPEEPLLPAAPFAPKPKLQRHSYSLKDKYTVLKQISKAEDYIKENLKPEEGFFMVSVLELVQRSTGIPLTTLRDWVAEGTTIRAKYEANKLARKLKRTGAGRKARFPVAEAAVAKLARDRRKACKLVSKSMILKNLKIEAEKENKDLFRNTKFSPEMVSGFMRRNRFSLRYPSCIRKHNLEEAILICRAYHRELLSVIADTGPEKFALKPLDPSFGRFLLKYRFNGDEVPYRFGRVKSIVSVTGEDLTHVTWPDGWESRLGTLFLLMDALGTFPMGIVLILHGSFDQSTKKRVEEFQKLQQTYPNVKLYSQKKAWMDGQVLAAITRDCYLPMIRKLWIQDGVDCLESLLQLDNGPGRGDEKFLRILKENCKSYLQKSPPLQTGFVQMIDDNCGRIFRDLACDCIESVVEELSVDAVASFTAEKKRELMVKGAQYAFEKWMDPNNDHYRQIGIRSALRTGLAMRIDNNCFGVRPNRFPEDYPSTISPASNAPIQAYRFEATAPVLPTVVAQVPINTRVEVQLGTAAMPSGSILRVNMAEPADFVSVRVVPPEPPRLFQEEVAVFDGWSDEEDRVFLDEEVDQSESSSDDEATPSRFRRRRRWCLFGCDCERPRGRKCCCERSGDTYCSKKCGCDPNSCRARKQIA